MSWSIESQLDESRPISRKQIIWWWESRRLRFNMCVGMMGILTLALMITAGSAAVESGIDFEEPLGYFLFPILLAIMANLCYTSGWIIDLVFYSGEPRYFLFKNGLLISCIITLLPGIWAVSLWLTTLISGHKLT